MRILLFCIALILINHFNLLSDDKTGGLIFVGLMISFFFCFVQDLSEISRKN